jgi:hypothetical protein
MSGGLRRLALLLHKAGVAISFGREVETETG